MFTLSLRLDKFHKDLLEKKIDALIKSASNEEGHTLNSRRSELKSFVAILIKAAYQVGQSSARIHSKEKDSDEETRN